MIFRKNNEPSCSYCLFGQRMSDEEVICSRRGVVSSGGRCRRFRYDPLKRDPPVHLPLDVSSLTEEDFTL